MTFVENKALGDWQVGFINRLHLYKGKGAGEPIKLRPWQERIIRDLLSRVDPTTGLRQYREALIALPKKNGKSTLIAALAVLQLTADGENGAEVYSVASTRDQAAIVFRTAAHMVENDPHLRKVCVVNHSRRRIVHLPTNSFYQALSADVTYNDGIDASAVIYDELHRAPDATLYELLKNSMAAREQGLMVNITTAGSDKATICGEVWDYAEKVRDGAVKDERFYSCIYAAPQDADWKDPEVWKKANPALGDFLGMDDMREQCERAIKQPSRLASFKRYRLNIWAESDDAWLPLVKWDACRSTIDLADLIGHRCIAGLDLSSTSDLTAEALWFPDDDVLIVRLFCPGENLSARQESTGVPYQAWAEQGFITPTPGNVVDYGVVEAQLEQDAERFNVEAVMIDRWNSTQMQTNLGAKGLNVMQFGQGFASMNAPSKEFEARVMGGRLKHDGNPVLRWMLSNTVVEVDAAGNIKPSKKRAKGKIDGIVAAVMAIGGSLGAEAEDEPYATPGGNVL